MISQIMIMMMPLQVERSLEEMEALLGGSGPDYRQVMTMMMMMIMIRMMMMMALLGRSGPDYRQVLHTYVISYEDEDEDDEDNHHPNHHHHDDQVRRWRQCVSRIEPLAGLIFGLELRLEEAKEGRQPLEVVVNTASTSAS